MTLNNQLYDAAKSGDLKLAKSLVEQGANINARGDYGKMPIHAAADSGNLDLVKWMVNEQKVDIKTKGLHNRTAIHHAAHAGKVEVAKWLISQGVEFHEPDTLKSTPIRYAIKEKKWETVALLVGHGADIEYLKARQLDMYAAATLADSIAQGIKCDINLPKGQEELFFNRFKWKWSTSDAFIDNIQDFMRAISNLKLPNDLDAKINKMIVEEQENLLQSEAELMYKLKQSNTPMPLWMPISDLSDVLEGEILEFYKKQYPRCKDLLDEYISNENSTEPKDKLVSKIKDNVGAFISSLSENEMRELIKRSDKKEVSEEAKISSIIERILSSPILPKAAAKILSSVQPDIDKLLAEGASEELEMAQSLVFQFENILSYIGAQDALTIYSVIYEDALLAAAWQEPKKIKASNIDYLFGKLQTLTELFPTDQAQELFGRIAKSGEKLLHDTVCKPDHVGTIEVLGEVVASDSCSSGVPLPAFEGGS